MAPAAFLTLERHLWPKEYGPDIWMVLDCARDQGLFALMLESRLEFSCLYSGSLPPALESVAPHLVRMEQDDPRSHWFLERALGDHRGILLRCDSTMSRVRRHLRGLLTVRSPTGEALLFRFYDPRVLRIFLPTCYPEELRTMFGPIERFWAEDETSEIVVEFGVVDGELTRSEVGLSPKSRKNLYSVAVI